MDNFIYNHITKYSLYSRVEDLTMVHGHILQDDVKETATIWSRDILEKRLWWSGL
jgi:hypothetical protein